MKITYTQNGDYFIPDITLEKQKSIGHFGRLHKEYLRQFRPAQYSELILSEKLYDHCAEVEEAARNRLDILIPQLMEQYGVNEKLKAENQMLWVGKMNMIREMAEESVRIELVYC